ncbi:ABC transporter permease [Salinarimonas chemoclinalis]|uniref:ABC transporter permease n=1 Tax=Salinarimonas chemoclinalis TaxID=3241599 RepID=UPI0035561F29
MIRVRPVLEYGAAFAVLVTAWWYASGPMGMPPYLLPSPQATVLALVREASTGSLAGHLAFTLRSIALGLALGAVAGVALAYVLYRVPLLSTLLDGPLVVLQSAPKIALAPLFVVWFGLGLEAKLALVFSLVFFPVLIGALAGLRAIDPRLHDIAALLRLGAIRRFAAIDLPAALPGIFVGLKVGGVQALVGAILAEWISGDRGLGFLMTFAAATYRAPLLFGAVLLTALLGVALHVALGLAERRLLAWNDADER